MKIIVALVLIIIPAAIRDIYAHDRSTLLPYLINKPVSSKQHGRTSSTTIRPAVRPNSTTDCRAMHVIDLPACLPVMLGLGSSFRHCDRRNTCNMDCLAEKPCTYSPRSQAPGTCLRRSPSSTSPPLLSMCILYTWMEKARRGWGPVRGHPA